MNTLEKRIIDISYKKGLTHIGSCLTHVNFIDECYKQMKDGDKFVLSSGHAFLALAVVLEKHRKLDAEKLIDKHGTHPNRDLKDEILVSTGSLGQGVPIAVGMAIANPQNTIYIVSSDGEMAEGSCLEALRIAAELNLENIRLGVIANGYGAYGEIDTDWLATRLQSIYPTLMVKVNMFQYPRFLNGQSAHYHKLSKEDYEQLTQ